MRQKQGHTPLVSLASLPLFGPPLPRTSAKYVATVGQTERSHQKVADV